MMTELKAPMAVRVHVHLYVMGNRQYSGRTERPSTSVLRLSRRPRHGALHILRPPDIHTPGHVCAGIYKNQHHGRAVHPPLLTYLLGAVQRCSEEISRSVQAGDRSAGFISRGSPAHRRGSSSLAGLVPSELREIGADR